MIKEFKEFAMKGSVVDMAVGIIIGAAFGLIVRTMVSDVVMPPIGLLLGNVDFANLFIVLSEGVDPGPYLTLAAAQEAGAVTINYGIFINTVISFLVVAWVLFMIVKSMNTAKRKEEEAPAAPTTKDCPFCFSTISIKATRCAHCTAEIA